MVTSRAEDSELIRRKALHFGFSHVGFARAEALDAEAGLLREWLARGYQAGMQWMERNLARRVDPRNIVEGAESVICLAMNYYTPHAHSGDKRHGKISRYAWGEDYHDIMDTRLRAFEEWLQVEFPGVRSRRYVDTGPVMEKAWAVRAGIGWLGKHSNVITRDRGSWIFLGELITTLPLDYDEAIGDYCGTCTACIDACPTAAITEPYVVDSRRCIPYMTIEHRGDELPEESREGLDRWVFGCDICQDVCPWNSFASETQEEAFQPREGAQEPDLRALALISDEEFRARFRGSPVARAKARGLRRNARTVLAQQESYTDR
ncbi:MAG: tRNA epoxyqueuosine(34) reductase QueG [Bacteroidota bacterium]|nr:tRNA epoxyqueuosine(34) reductase QueG [Bacteroidota bacterium]